MDNLLTTQAIVVICTMQLAMSLVVIQVFRDVTLCQLANGYQHFEGPTILWGTGKYLPVDMANIWEGLNLQHNHWKDVLLSSHTGWRIWQKQKLMSSEMWQYTGIAASIFRVRLCSQNAKICLGQQPLTSQWRLCFIQLNLSCLTTFNAHVEAFQWNYM